MHMKNKSTLYFDDHVGAGWLGERQAVSDNDMVRIQAMDVHGTTNEHNDSPI
jgi:hypothetical protein